VVEVLTSPEKTDGGYELRSRGPASQGFDALDIKFFIGASFNDVLLLFAPRSCNAVAHRLA
jgi:hypothetical protein